MRETRETERKREQAAEAFREAMGRLQRQAEAFHERGAFGSLEVHFQGGRVTLLRTVETERLDGH